MEFSRSTLAVALFIISAFARQLRSDDTAALLRFKKMIAHDPTGYVTRSWSEEPIDGGGCPSSWNGVVCDAGGRVAGLVLDNLNLSADVDLLVFSNLTKLSVLSMANNLITGKIPAGISLFRNLEHLDLSGNLFSSGIPLAIGNLTNLKNASLASNNFSGELPHSISRLASIEFLDLSINALAGEIPASISTLGTLVYLNLSHNRFAGGIPAGLQRISGLRALDLHRNFLDGGLHFEFLLFTNAEYVDLSSNRFVSQKFSLEISDSIKHLNLSHNRLSGNLAQAAGGYSAFQNLRVLDLSYNQFAGDLPEFSFVYDLQVLNLSNNGFSGSFPGDLLRGDPLILRELDLSSNNLTGPISTVLSSPSTLRFMNLSSNLLSGELPLLVGELAVVDLSGNLFEGSINRILKWYGVEFLDLSKNRLSGTIPELKDKAIDHSPRLNHLNLSNNLLTGFVPATTLQLFPGLVVLDISFNGLNGSLPDDLLTVPPLQELHLQHNSMTSSILLLLPSTELSLRSIDLSHNMFSGSLPRQLDSFRLLERLDLAENRFTGVLPSGLPPGLKSLNVSYNNLSGVIPNNLRRFPTSSFRPGNAYLQSPGFPKHSTSSPATKKPIMKVVITVTCVLSALILVLISTFLYYIYMMKKGNDIEEGGREGGGIRQLTTVSTDDLLLSKKEEMRQEKLSDSVKTDAPPLSPESGDSSIGGEILKRLDGKSPDLLVGELYFLDDTFRLTQEELSKAPAEVLGSSSVGTSYRATLDDGVLLTVKWLKESTSKPKKDFEKEARKLANIRHPNVVTLRGYYWGPTQHEKLIFSEYISAGNLPSFLYDRGGRRNPILPWGRRLKIAVDVARGLNYLHFDRAVPHGNLKSTNILLEGTDLNARVSDYCLHRLITNAAIAGQIQDSASQGYQAPELASSKRPQPSFKSDVYSFGILLLELLSGRRAQEVSAVATREWKLLRAAEGDGGRILDEALGEEARDPVVESGMKAVTEIALRCVRSPAPERPGIKTVYEELSSI